MNDSENILTQLIESFSKKGFKLTNGGVSIKDVCIGLNNTPSGHNRVCLVTGFGISMQRSNSYLLSHKGLEYYRVFNYKVFESLEKRFLSDKWKHGTDKIKIKEIAHNIRNTHYNRLRRIDESQLLLDFDNNTKLRNTKII